MYSVNRRTMLSMLKSCEEAAAHFSEGAIFPGIYFVSKNDLEEGDNEGLTIFGTDSSKAVVGIIPKQWGISKRFSVYINQDQALQTIAELQDSTSEEVIICHDSVQGLRIVDGVNKISLPISAKSYNRGYRGERWLAEKLSAFSAEGGIRAMPLEREVIEESMSIKGSILDELFIVYLKGKDYLVRSKAILDLEIADKSILAFNKKFLETCDSMISVQKDELSQVCNLFEGDTITLSFVPEFLDGKRVVGDVIVSDSNTPALFAILETRW